MDPVLLFRGWSRSGRELWCVTIHCTYICPWPNRDVLFSLQMTSNQQTQTVTQTETETDKISIRRLLWKLIVRQTSSKQRTSSLPVRPSVRLSVHLSVRLSVCLSVSLSICLSLSVCLSACLYVCLCASACVGAVSQWRATLWRRDSSPNARLITKENRRE